MLRINFLNKKAFKDVGNDVIFPRSKRMSSYSHVLRVGSQDTSCSYSGLSSELFQSHDKKKRSASSLSFSRRIRKSFVSIPRAPSSQKDVTSMHPDHDADSTCCQEGSSMGLFDVNGVFRLLMDVRDSELDQFGVVNNAVYSSYIQHAMHEAFASLGFQIESLTSRGGALALANLSLSFLAPLRSRDRFEVSVWVEKVSGARLVLGQKVSRLPYPRELGSPKGGDMMKVDVLRAEATVVFLDSRYQPVRVPADIKSVFQRLLEQNRTD
ncbi:hypothetical protein CEUSTIGMA_g8226.t1 [Chlamydomonas eustigma]|uniref:Thioesterase domain-containing protein n=1 Tax=Chlamydomonas eustigma TaxID=1157962 RepID=A0A250XDF0_9CHLO|nr:hypothetical protein CEUSTIGMA_g8226.t1 [Chlamydomonas eustigma]|eukprot:GAX80790.1 hypothetical protein CEUSTIGMA_g8226.t1 [Chlamydomonas eustigma]